MDLHVTETIFAFALVVVLAIVLRRRGVIPDEQRAVFAKLLTNIVLPAVIIVNMGQHAVERRQLLLVVAMLGAGIGSMLVAYVMGRLLQLSRPTLGALMIASSFGSSALLGYPMVHFVFPGNAVAMEDAILLSELGVGLPIFTLCPLIAMYFGRSADSARTKGVLLKQYLCSPVFIAVAIGLILPYLPIDRTAFIPATLFKSLDILEGSLSVLACVVLGLSVHVPKIGRLLPLVIVSTLIQMLLQPWLAGLQGSAFGFSTMPQQVLVLVAAMPSSVLGPVFAVQFDCDGETASALTVAQIVVGAVLIPVVFGLLG